MPVLQPLEIWEESGRRAGFGKGMFALQDRRGRDMVLAPTHEEVIVYLVRQHVSSYRDLPRCSTRFRASSVTSRVPVPACCGSGSST